MQFGVTLSSETIKLYTMQFGVTLSSETIK